MNFNHRTPAGFRSGGVTHHHRAFDSPPRRPMGGEAPGGFGFNGNRSMGGDGPGDFGFNSNRLMGAEGSGEFGFNGHQPPPLSGQKRGFPFSSGRAGPSPGEHSHSDRSDGGNFAKLFVGSVPRTACEEDIRPLFEEHGNVIEVALIKDRKTGQHQGCCFIKYATSEEADQAIRALHNQLTLPGGIGPIQVRYADGERERLGAVEYKLFVGSLNKQAPVNEVEEIFSKYGRVEDVYLMRDENKQSRGCGFVKYSNRDMALAAINGLNGIYTMRGCDQPLIVRFADPKRPRQGDSRGPAFGGSGFGPRFDAPGTRLPSKVSDPMGDRMPPSNTWRPMHPNMGPSSNAGFHGMGPPLLPKSGDMALPTNAGGPMTGMGAHIDGRFQQNFNQPRPQIPPVNQQTSPLQKPVHSSQTPIPYPQTSTHSSLRPRGQPQHPLSASPLPSQQGLGISGQFPTSQTQTQQSPLSAKLPQAPLDSRVQSNTALRTPNQQQVPPSMQQQQPFQPLQQPPSQLAQMLSQQKQNLQASFHSSQQAFSQLQQQLQMMQPSSQALTSQQNAEATNKQSPWAGTVAQGAVSTHVAAPAADVPSSTSAASSVPAISQNTTLAKCNWTEHLSPEGFKYYYNSVTGESRWEKPEEFGLSEQQQQRPYAQQSRTQSQPSVLAAQQVAQIQQAQPQSNLQGQVFNQQQMQLPSVSSSFQAYGVTGHQNNQEVGFKQLQASAISGGDPRRYSQGMNTAQELMWKNKPAGFNSGV
ncbi:flowering time control protein FCA isoform X2 [Lotus japonicus]|uniref:flowering time control protein FCA isoform X2 n=1 Tax=Lotus japonicus TaxID=34305 RepID=UPI0025906EE9|nr:flowering time control protein FCA isoform X2 [Lotus japonicus]